MLDNAARSVVIFLAAIFWLIGRAHKAANGNVVVKTVAKNKLASMLARWLK